jgi:transcriptional regulator with XRE-family HTH domain
MSFGKMLRVLRDAAGLSQEGLARAALVSTATVARLERLDMDPSWSTVQRLAKALGVDCTAFQVEDKPATPPPPKKRGSK